MRTTPGNPLAGEKRDWSSPLNGDGQESLKPIARVLLSSVQYFSTSFFHLIGVLPCSCCESGLPLPPFALRSAKTLEPQFGPALRRMAYQRGGCACRGPLLLWDLTRSLGPPVALTSAYRGVPAFASLPMAGTSDYIPHGFRSSFRDWAGEVSSYPCGVCEIALAHVNGNKVASAYWRVDLSEKRRNLMEEWA